MLIFDASILIAIFEEAGRPDIVDALLELDQDLMIPSNLLNLEIIGAVTRDGIETYIAAGKMYVLRANTPEEIDEFSTEVRGRKSLKHGLGELDAMLAYKKQSAKGHSVRCVLDDRRARNLASRLGIEFTGLCGLLDELRDRGVMGQEVIDEIKARLRSKGYRI